MTTNLTTPRPSVTARRRTALDVVRAGFPVRVRLASFTAACALLAVAGLVDVLVSGWSR